MKRKRLRNSDEIRSDASRASHMDGQPGRPRIGPCPVVLRRGATSAVFNVQFQTGQGIIPSTREDLEAPPTFREAGRVDRPDMLTTLTVALNDPGGGKDVKVLCHTLPRHRPKPLSKHRD